MKCRADNGEAFCIISTFCGVWKWIEAEGEAPFSFSWGSVKYSSYDPPLSLSLCLSHTHTHQQPRSPFAVCVKVISQTQLRNCYIYRRQAAEYRLCPVKRAARWCNGKLKGVQTVTSRQRSLSGKQPQIRFKKNKLLGWIKMYCIMFSCFTPVCSDI